MNQLPLCLPTSLRACKPYRRYLALVQRTYASRKSQLPRHVLPPPFPSESNCCVAVRDILSLHDRPSLPAVSTKQFHFENRLNIFIRISPPFLLVKSQKDATGTGALRTVSLEGYV